MTLRSMMLKLLNIWGFQDGTPIACVRTMVPPYNSAAPPADSRSVSILAKSLYREMKGGGYSPKDVMSLATELLGMVATDVRALK